MAIPIDPSIMMMMLARQGVTNPEQLASLLAASGTPPPQIAAGTPPIGSAPNMGPVGNAGQPVAAPSIVPGDQGPMVNPMALSGLAGLAQPSSTPARMSAAPAPFQSGPMQSS